MSVKAVPERKFGLAAEKFAEVDASNSMTQR